MKDIKTTNTATQKLTESVFKQDRTRWRTAHWKKISNIAKPFFFGAPMSKAQGDSPLPVNGFVYFPQCSWTRRAVVAATVRDRAHSRGRLRNENHFPIYMRSTRWPSVWGRNCIGVNTFHVFLLFVCLWPLTN